MERKKLITVSEFFKSLDVSVGASNNSYEARVRIYELRDLLQNLKYLFYFLSLLLWLTLIPAWHGLAYILFESEVFFNGYKLLPLEIKSEGGRFSFFGMFLVGGSVVWRFLYLKLDRFFIFLIYKKISRLQKKKTLNGELVEDLRERIDNISKMKQPILRPG